MMELWPFTNFHDLNLDWIIKKYKQLENDEAEIKESLEGAESARDAAIEAAERAEAAESTLVEYVNDPQLIEPMITDAVDSFLMENPVEYPDDVSEFVGKYKKYNSDIDTEYEDFSIQWIDGSYYNISSGDLTTLAGYAYTVKKRCEPGDILEIEPCQGQILFWDEDDNYLSYKTVAANQQVRRTAPANSYYYALNNSNSNARALSGRKYHTETELVENQRTSPAKLIADETEFQNGYFRALNTGVLYEGSAYDTWWCLPMLEVEPAHKYRTSTMCQIVFFDSDMTITGSINNVIGGIVYSGVPVEMDFTTPANTKYASINSKTSHEKVYDLEYVELGIDYDEMKLQGKKIVCFGDSIIGNYAFGDNVPGEIEKYTGGKTYNCGFGGARMELLHNDTAHTNPFSMCGIVDALESGSWTSQDQYALSISNRVYFRLQILKNIDFNDVDVVTIAYGTNEYGYPQDDPNDPYNKYTYAGATRYSIKKLLELYPHLRIVLITPIFRWFTDSNESSDTKQNPTYGGKLTDNVETLIETGKELKIPVIDLYYTLGINDYNHTEYFGDDDEQTDGTHINSFGRIQMGKRLAGEVNRLF